MFSIVLVYLVCQIFELTTQNCSNKRNDHYCGQQNVRSFDPKIKTIFAKMESNTKNEWKTERANRASNVVMQENYYAEKFVLPYERSNKGDTERTNCKMALDAIWCGMNDARIIRTMYNVLYVKFRLVSICIGNTFNANWIHLARRSPSSQI